jgi:Zn-dependent protease
LLGSPPEGRARLHHYGPWALFLSVAAVLAVVEVVRHHVFSGFSGYYFLALFPSIILHEVSHGYVAHLCGDETAKEQGRLTLNPLRHIDPVGTVILPLLLIWTTGAAFGWAKPVPVSVDRLRHPRNQSLLVSLAGPALNLALAMGSGLALRLTTGGGASLAVDPTPAPDELLIAIGVANLVIAVFNLLPIPPLDGSAVIERLLPERLLYSYYRIRPYTLVIVMAVVLLDQGLISNLFAHAFSFWQRLWLPNL